ncbi:MAG TPA: serine hydrolase [Cyanobacteria bacterium UBA8803]|nr:serine hydrolase [Cyanobacteria bacterium UBA9273]HBL61486.1 serine hydrolase [Cyanobacteria bacterium UBA8803]
MRQRGFPTIKLAHWLLLAILSFSLSFSGLTMPSLAQSGAKQLPILDSQPQQVTEPEQSVPASPNALGLNDPQELKAFVDNFFNKEMSKTHVPGAVISVVKDGKLFFAKGYGYANLEKKILVEADKTLFRVASLSKVFTATAAMQLYERGQLDLDADVNKYLTGFQVDNPYSEPVTAARMMMHTDGTTVRRIGLAARTEAEMQPLGDYLAHQMPPVVWPPGKLYSYSSHSTALLGYVVEKISGTPFAEYIDKNIFQALKMHRSTFLQPPPPELADNLAVGYQYQSGNFKPVPFLYLNIAPAAAMSTTATDMANFMIAHLLRGRYENLRILEEDTVWLMHETHFAHHPKLPGTSYSFRERLENNIRMIGHLGSLRGYSSSLTLMPERNIGIFIASNSFSGIHEKLLSQFLDRYFPAPETPAPKPLAFTDEQLDRFTGTYRDVEYPRATFLKPSAVFKHINIKKGHNGTLVIKTPGLFFLSNPQNITLIPVGPQLFKRANDDALTAFGDAVEDEASNQIKFAFNPLWPKIGAYERVPWYETAWVQLGLLGFCVLVFLSAFFIWPIRPLIRRLRGKHFQIERQYSRAWLVAGLIGTLNLVFLIGLPLSLWLYGAWKLAYGVPAFVIAFLCLPLITSVFVLILGLLLYTGQAWQKDWSFMERSHYSLITLAALAFIPFLLYWNLLGFQF